MLLITPRFMQFLHIFLFYKFSFVFLYIIAINSMNAEVFIKLSKEGEGTKVEYKTCTEKISESLYETVCSFLNHSGG